MNRGTGLTLAALAVVIGLIWMCMMIPGCSHREAVTKTSQGSVEQARPGTPIPAPALERAKPGKPGSRGTERPYFYQPIYFDFDKADIRDDQTSRLIVHATALLDHPGYVVVEGHCDERGTIEYNLALGMRRAESIRNYLLKIGLQKSIVTVSYGKERPVWMGHDERAWAHNRRCEFRLMKGRPP